MLEDVFDSSSILEPNFALSGPAGKRKSKESKPNINGAMQSAKRHIVGNNLLGFAAPGKASASVP